MVFDGVLSFKPRPLYCRAKNPGTHWLEGFAGLRESLDVLEKKSETQIVQPVA
jgi:hypothetical protein